MAWESLLSTRGKERGMIEDLWYHLRVMASIQTEILTWLRFPYLFESWDA